MAACSYDSAERGAEPSEREGATGPATDGGSATAEAGVLIVVAVTVVGVLVEIITSPTMNDLLENLFATGLGALF